jgi:filamentous hemagglutinin family protein
MTSLFKNRFEIEKVFAIATFANIAIATISNGAFAQNISFDGTLSEKKTLTGPNYVIRQQNGQTVDNNLFHSFEKFGLDNGETVTFQGNAAVENIFSRVTGASVSVIDGLIKTAGTNANLFLMNPNGIIFGQNASLDVKGSFVATTANGIQFGDRGFFSTTNPQSPDLLKINPSAFFFNQIAPNPIINRSKQGLEVPNGNSILLVGGEIRLDGGSLSASGGRIELGGLSSPGTITLSQKDENFHLTFPSILARADVFLSQQASVDVSGDREGTIQIQGRQITLADESKVSADSRSGGSKGERGREFKVQSSKFKIKRGRQGRQGGIIIAGQTLIVRDGSQISSATRNEDNSGNIKISATESVEAIGTSIDGNKPSKIASDSQNEASGDAGSLTIETRQLTIREGARISSSVSGEGRGNTISIKASDSVILIGTSPGERRSSAISVQTRGTSNAGNIVIETQRLSLQKGAEISAATFGAGKGGNVAIAADLVELTGTSATGQRISRLFAGTGDPSEVLRDNESESNSEPENAPLTGDGGNINLTSKQVTISDSAQISVNEEGIGQAGNIEITTDSLNLDRNGKITASTQSGNGGNLRLTVNDLLVLSRQSEILTDAGVAGVGGDGGNIDINARFIFVVPNEDSNITANAFEGKGGNINISTGGIFGIQFREQETPLSDITASSQFGTQGQVAIAEPNVDFSKTIVQLPSLIDSSQQIARGCPSQGRVSEAQLGSFTITGRGGLPPSPTDPRTSEAVLTNWATLDTEGESEAANLETQVKTQKTAKPIIEAQGWVKNSRGEIVLFAQMPNVAPYAPTIPNSICSSLKNEVTELWMGAR